MNQSVAAKLRPGLLRLEFDGTATPVKTILFVVLVAGWLLPGLTGHDPWKSDEAINFGVAYDMLKSGDWVVPTVAGQPFLDRPPLYAMVAALAAKLFAPLLPLHDGARLATGFFMLIVIACVAVNANALFGPRFGRLTALLFMGTLGLLIRGHEMSHDVAALAGCAVALSGLAHARRHAGWAGIVFGIGLGMAFMSKGIVPALMLALTAACLPLGFRDWRTRAFAQSLFIAALAALPWLVAWPAALWRESPAYGAAFWAQQLEPFSALTRGDLRAGKLTYLVRNLVWYAWPSLPIVLAKVWYERGKAFTDPALQLPWTALIVFLGVLSMAQEARDSSAMPLVLPLAWLAASAVDSLRRSASSSLDWFGMMTFGLLSALLWLGWLAALTGWPDAFARWLAERATGIEVEFSWLRLTLAAALSVLWLAIIAHARRTNRRAIVNWTSGITMFWLLAMILWLPVIDQARSYRGVANGMKSALTEPINCVIARGVGEAQRSLIAYHSGLRVFSIEHGKEQRCVALLVQGERKQELPVGAPWQKIWEGARASDQRELFRLYRREG